MVKQKARKLIQFPCLMLKPYISLARREGLEPPTYWFVASHSIRLSYRRTPSSSDCLYIISHPESKCKSFFKFFYCNTPLVYEQRGILFQYILIQTFRKPFGYLFFSRPPEHLPNPRDIPSTETQVYPGSPSQSISSPRR